MSSLRVVKSHVLGHQFDAIVVDDDGRLLFSPHGGWTKHTRQVCAAYIAGHQAALAEDEPEPDLPALALKPAVRTRPSALSIEKLSIEKLSLEQA